MLAAAYSVSILEDADMHKAAIILYHGLYRFIHIIFGLQIALGAFQLTLNVIRFGIRKLFALLYNDDNVIFGKTLKQCTNQNRKNPFAPIQQLNQAKAHDV